MSELKSQLVELARYPVLGKGKSDAESSCTSSLLLAPGSSLETWGTDLCGLQQEALKALRFWLGLANGRHEQEIKGWEKSEVEVIIALILSLLGHRIACVPPL